MGVGGRKDTPPPPPAEADGGIIASSCDYARGANITEDDEELDGLVTEKSGNIFRVGVFLDFASSSARTMHLYGAYVQMSKRNRIGPHQGAIERLLREREKEREREREREREDAYRVGGGVGEEVEGVQLEVTDHEHVGQHTLERGLPFDSNTRTTRATDSMGMVIICAICVRVPFLTKKFGVV